MKFDIRHRATGSAVTFGTVLALVLVLIGVAFLAYTMLMGGQREMQNAVDAGMLNVGKKVVDKIGTPLLPTEDELLYIDVCNDSTKTEKWMIDPSKFFKKYPEINLRRINRVWAKAMLIAVNADAADKDGKAGSGLQNAKSAFDGAKAISDRLAAKLNGKGDFASMTGQDDPTGKLDNDGKAIFYNLFNDLSSKNSVRMLGTTASVTALKGDNWQQSLMQRGCESNITAAPPQYTFPPGYQDKAPKDLLMKSSRGARAGAGGQDLWFLRGYAPIKLAGYTFWQVPFVFDERTHMVSGREFESCKANANPVGDWDKPIPNAFSGEGVVQNVKQGSSPLKATSFVLTNPDQPFKMALPYSWVHIKIDDPMAHWYFFPGFPLPPPPKRQEYGDPKKYDFKPTTLPGPRMPLGGFGMWWVKAGDDVGPFGADLWPPTLDHLIFETPGAGNATIDGYLLNRCNEMTGKIGKIITSDELHECLRDPICATALLADQRDFYLFCPDGEKLTVLPKDIAFLKAPWMLAFQGNEPDGEEQQIVDDADYSPAPIVNIPDANPIPGLMVCPPPGGIGWGNWAKDVWWTPGTGYNHCLGKLRVQRRTDVYSFAFGLPDLLKLFFL
jgi:hypothetical protein